MKKLFLVLCVVIMFFGIVGCPTPNDQSTFGSGNFTPAKVTPSDTGPGDEIPNEPSATPEPATLILLGSGLVGLAGIGRKKFFKKD